MNPEQVAQIIADGLRELMGQRIDHIAPVHAVAPDTAVATLAGLTWVRDNADSLANNLERRLFARFEAHVRTRQTTQ
ncbi:hypothetical protein [Mycobacterium malmoense]|uniref:hypothetical protein n=1 Tax=Mycobacterium malmoense TaxID=1780 RepID=UPI0008F88D04|nr:hypothetical protein [Mycobacterium malmoense]OIN80198.1 hypothetical protein BMG05_13195 [Mycobacterium malmoense]